MKLLGSLCIGTWSVTPNLFLSIRTQTQGRFFLRVFGQQARLMYLLLHCKWSLSWHLYSVPLPGGSGSLLGMSCPGSHIPWHHSDVHATIYVPSRSLPQVNTAQQLRGWSRAAQYIHLDTCSTELLFSWVLVLCHQPKIPALPPAVIFLPQTSLAGDFVLLLPFPFLLWQILPWLQ